MPLKDLMITVVRDLECPIYYGQMNKGLDDFDECCSHDQWSIQKTQEILEMPPPSTMSVARSFSFKSEQSYSERSLDTISKPWGSEEEQRQAVATIQNEIDKLEEQLEEVERPIRHKTLLVISRLQRGNETATIMAMKQVLELESECEKLVNDIFDLQELAKEVMRSQSSFDYASAVEHILSIPLIPVCFKNDADILEEAKTRWDAVTLLQQHIVEQQKDTQRRKSENRCDDSSDIAPLRPARKHSFSS